MTPTEINKTYINWKDYILFRKIFESWQISTQISEDIDRFIKDNSVAVKDKEREHFINICQIIRELFNIMSSNDSCKNGKCCNYINYYIRERIRDHFHPKEKAIFEHFTKYIECKKTDECYNTCMPKIQYIEEADFKKMDELYDLYEHYETILNPDPEENNSPIECSDIDGFIEEYNDIILKYNDDKPFHKELKNLRCSIEYNELFNKNCKNTLTGILENEDNPWNKDECNESQEIQYLKEYLERKNAYFSKITYIQPANMNVIIASALSSVFLGTVLYCIYKYITSGNYLRNLFPRMKRMNRNINDETHQHEMCNRKDYHRNLKGKCYNVSYVSERKY
ncbi:variable surface protein [Plasmodium gonderi]|uniref:Variable surface protein n=1 Tax=Plasmodium gonderi TaxID=77519 RepID=A0A1Y1JNI0_PLAGO|nr:variable surface protein [Plasmodium gonderi]GAW84146.1 variable surface protein [Plasmodium gonderi]